MQYFISLPVLFVSIIFHEIAHGYVAKMCGDNTARDSGRLTLNPIAHIDLFGSIILPALLVFTQAGIVMGWAKPVPINYRNLRNPKRDIIFVAIAGIATNFFIAIISSIIFSFTNSELLKVISFYATMYNLFLAVFNLIPIPPLDGSRVISSLLPPSIAYQYSKIEPYGIAIIFLLVYFNMFNFLGSFVSWFLALLLGI